MNRHRSVSRPRVSVLLPVYNAEAYLQECLDSIDRQSLSEIEVVVVDDGSDDTGAPLLERWASGRDSVRLIRQPHRGLVPSLNHGLEACRAPYVARLDADDIMHTRRLELQAELLDSSPDVGVVSCWVNCFPSRDVAGGFQVYERWLNSLDTHDAMARERFIESPLAHPSAMFRRDVVLDAGGYSDTAWPEDYELWLRLFERGVVFAKIRRWLYFWREHVERLTRTDDRYAAERFRECRVHYLARGPLAHRSEVVVWGAGRTGRRLVRSLDEHGVDVVAFVDIDPAKIGRRVQGRPVHPSEEIGELSRERTVLAAVASRGARELIRPRLNEHKLQEGRDFWCVA